MRQMSGMVVISVEVDKPKGNLLSWREKQNNVK